MEEIILPKITLDQMANMLNQYAPLVYLFLAGVGVYYFIKAIQLHREANADPNAEGWGAAARRKFGNFVKGTFADPKVLKETHKVMVKERKEALEVLATDKNELKIAEKLVNELAGSVREIQHLKAESQVASPNYPQIAHDSNEEEARLEDYLNLIERMEDLWRKGSFLTLGPSERREIQSLVRDGDKIYSFVHKAQQQSSQLLKRVSAREKTMKVFRSISANPAYKERDIETIREFDRKLLVIHQRINQEVQGFKSKLGEAKDFLAEAQTESSKPTPNKNQLVADLDQVLLHIQESGKIARRLHALLDKGGVDGVEAGLGAMQVVEGILLKLDDLKTEIPRTAPSASPRAGSP